MASYTSNLGVKLRTLFETLNPLSVDGEIFFEADGIQIKSAHRDISLMVDLQGDSIDATYEFHQRSKLSVSFASLHHALSSATPSDIVTFNTNDESLLKAKRPYLSVMVKNDDTQATFLSKVYILLDDLIPFRTFHTQTSARISLCAGTFLKLLRSSQKRGDTIQFSILNSKLVAQCSGDESSLQFSIPLKQNKSMDVMKSDLYSVKRLLQIAKCTNLSATIILWLDAKDSRILLRYNIGSLGSVTFCLERVKQDTSPLELSSIQSVRPKKPTKIKVLTFKRPVKRRKRQPNSTSCSLKK